jgi:hypothetical protein
MSATARFRRLAVACVGALAVLALAWELWLSPLRPGGSLVVMSGQSYLPEVYQLLLSEPSLSYVWTMAYMTLGPATQLKARPIGSNWKPLIWLVKGKYNGVTVRDVFENPIPDKAHHVWGQGEVGMADIVERMTSLGDLVVDPFLGAGTTGVVAVRSKRRFIGFDVDEKALASARARIAGANDTAAKG